MRTYLITIKIILISLLTNNNLIAQCTITSCPNQVILTGAMNWTDGTLATANGVLSVSGVTLGNVDCAGAGEEVGLEIYVYQLLPDGSRVELCGGLNATPDNFIYKSNLGIGPASDCTDTGFAIDPFGTGSIDIYDHNNLSGAATGMDLCEGGFYEVILVAYVNDTGVVVPTNQSVYSYLSANQYAEINLGNFFVNYTGEFQAPNPFPTPITTAVITGPNGESGAVTANCGEEVMLFFEGLSYIGRCRALEGSVVLPEFFPFCDPLDPFGTTGTYSGSIESEMENFLSYTINGGAPVIIRDGNGGDPATDAFGGQQTGPGNLPGLSDDECYTGICGQRPFPAPDSSCSGDVVVVTFQTVDTYSGQTVTDEMTITYTGESCNDCGPVCPTQANIVTNATEVCSGESITINGSTVGEGTATFTITESSGTLHLICRIIQLAHQ